MSEEENQSGSPKGTEGSANAGLYPDMAELAVLLPQYEMERVIGIGGMGAVYLARQSHLDRWVALKVLPVAAAANTEDAEMFNTEARAMARLSHPNIVAVYDFGQTTAGHMYLAMEYVDGADLHVRTLAGEVTPQRAREVILQLCDALHYAHTHGVIHRDIKPANLLITEDWQVKIVDFGLARDLSYAVHADADAGAYGTPEYTAPERFIIGESVDHRADIYSLGVVIHEILTGKTPRAAGAQAGLGLPDGFAGVLSKCLMRDPARRFQTAQAVKEALIAATSTEAPKPVVSVPPQHITTRRMPVQSPTPKPPAHALAPTTRTVGSQTPLYAIVGLIVLCVLGFLVWRDHYQEVPSRPTRPMLMDDKADELKSTSKDNPGKSTISEIPSDMESNKVVSEPVISKPPVMNKAIPTVLALAASTATAFSVDYKTQIEPIFRTKCYACHNAAKGKTKGDLALDPEKLSSVIGAGQLIVPGDPAKSNMLSVCKLPDDDSDVMPPKGKNRLTEAEVATFETWIKEGASLTPGGAAPAPAVAAAPAPAAGPQSWTSSDGKVVQAAFVSLQGDLITLKTADGKTFTFPVSRLSPESQAQAKTAAGM